MRPTHAAMTSLRVRHASRNRAHAVNLVHKFSVIDELFYSRGISAGSLRDYAVLSRSHCETFAFYRYSKLSYSDTLICWKIYKIYTERKKEKKEQIDNEIDNKIIFRAIYLIKNKSNFMFVNLKINNLIKINYKKLIILLIILNKIKLIN